MGEDRRADRWLTGLILAGMAAGVVLGLGARATAPAGAVVDGIAWMGVLFKQLLLLLIYPLVLASVFSGVVGLGDLRRAGRLALGALSYFAGTTAVSVLIGLVLVRALRPGEGFSLEGAGAIEPPAAAAEGLGGFFDQLLRHSVGNPFAALAEGNVLGIILFAILLALATASIGERGRPLVEVMDALNEATMRLTAWVMWLAPAGVLALVARVVRDQGTDALSALGDYAGTVVLGLGLHGLVVLPLVAWLVGGVSPRRLARALRRPLAVAFSTASSSATLPVTIRAAEEELGVPGRVARFVLPLGATVNMDGTALYEAVAAMFIAQAYGVDLDLGGQIVVFLTATLAAVGAAGIPSAGLVTMGIVLDAVGLPLEAVGIVLAVDRVLDMLRTSVNVEGDTVGSVVLGRLLR